MDNNLKKFIDTDEKNIRLAAKQGQIDGAAEVPLSSSVVSPAWELKFLNELTVAWKRYKDNAEQAKAELADHFHEISDKSERQLAKSEESFGQKQKKALDFLDAEIGETSQNFQSLKSKYESAQVECTKIANQLGRPLQTSMVGGYIPLMALLALAEIPVNRLAFELYFESMPAVSLLLSAAVGALLIFFAHTIGKQLKHTRCDITATKNSNTYLAIFGISALCILVMFYLGIMREQVVALQGVGGLNLEDLTLEDLSSSSGSSTSMSFTIGPAAFFLVVLNFAIFLTGVVAAFVRHDSHPFFEKLSTTLQSAESKFSAAERLYEQRQLEIMKDFASKVATSSDEYDLRASQIEELQAKRSSIDSEMKRSRQLVTGYAVRALQSYRKENMLSRKTPPPVSFLQSAEELVSGSVI